jgi:hypothetical protein
MTDYHADLFFYDFVVETKGPIVVTPRLPTIREPVGVLSFIPKKTKGFALDAIRLVTYTTLTMTELATMFSQPS